MSKIDLLEDNIEDGDKDQEFLVVSIDEFKQILETLSSLENNLNILLDHSGIGKYKKDEECKCGK